MIKRIPGIVSCGFGVISLIPNIMLGDSGTKAAIYASNIGLLASSSFVVGGIASAITKNPSYILPGYILQTSAFIVPDLIYNDNE